MEGPPQKKRRLHTSCKKERKESTTRVCQRVCQHVWKEDDIDFMSGWTEKSMCITYCFICYETKK